MPIPLSVSRSICSDRSSVFGILPTRSLLSAQRYLIEEPIVQIATRKTSIPVPLPIRLIVDPGKSTHRLPAKNEQATYIAAEIDQAIVEDPTFLDFMVRTGTVSRRKRSPAMLSRR